MTEDLPDIRDLEAPDAPVRVERAAGHALVATINRPEARNAVNGAVAQSLDRIVKAVEADPSIRVAVLTGAGAQMFSAGADLKEVAAGRVDSLRTSDGGFAGFVFAPRRKIWIAAVNGVAVGGGCELMLACDMAVAADTAEFGLPEVRRGLMALAGGLIRLPRALPRAVAMEMIATGTGIGAERAHQLGLVNRVVPAADLRGAALRLAETVAANAPFAVQESIALARRAWDLTEAELRDCAQESRSRLLETEDFREGPRAFLERRPPRWTGR